MGRNKSKSKQIEKRRNQRENAEFDAIELENVEYAKPVAVVNGGPSFNSKKFKKQKKKNRLKKAMMASQAVADVMMSEVSIKNQEKSNNKGSKGWHRITLTNAAKFEKELVLSSLAKNCPLPFTPVCVTKNGGNYYFFIESPSVATSLKSLDKKISLTHNFLMKIKVAPSPAPKHELNEEVRNKIKEIMSNRYNTIEKSLNLKSFHNDTLFVGEAAYVPLARSNVMNNVIRVIGEYIPDVRCIDLSENKLPSLDHFSLFEENTSNLEILNLSNNRLNDIRELEKLQDLQHLKCLRLDNNPLENKFPGDQRSEMINSIQKILPRLEKLNGETLPKNIQFEENCQSLNILLPAKIKLMSVDESAQGVLLNFLQQYYQVYDQNDRGPLINAYHPEAMFSVSAAYPPNSTSTGTNKLTQYQVDSRNLNMILQPSKRLNFLKIGHQKVVEFLNDLPKTSHDLDSFTLDVPLANPRLISLTVTGVFKETTQNPPPLRQFHRTFIILPQGSGFVITNDSLFITNAIGPQAKSAFQKSESFMPKISPNEAQNMVKLLSQKTNIRLDWAQKCLEECQWNLEVATAKFFEAKKEGKIPQEAYAFTSF